MAKDPETGRALALRAAMVEMLGHPAWETFSRELEQIELRLMDRLVSAESGDVQLIQGQIQGIRLAHYRPKQIIDQTPV